MIPNSATTTTTNPSPLELPAPTAWPLVLAFGITLAFAGLVTSEPVSVLGGILIIAGAVGWFRNVLPHEEHESVSVMLGEPAIATTRRDVARLDVASEPKRAWLPLEIYPVSAGIKGGLAGSVVMAGLAMLYGLISHNGIWYPINLLVAGFFSGAGDATPPPHPAFPMSAPLLSVPLPLITPLFGGGVFRAILSLFFLAPAPLRVSS